MNPFEDFELSNEETPPVFIPNVKKYNSGQEKLINAPFDKTIVGVAGAGTGKTTTIIARAVNVLKHFKTGNLILITFTRLAAQDLQTKIEKEVDAETARRVIVGTFHSIISKVIRKQAMNVGLSPDYTIIDDASSKSMYRMSTQQLAQDDREFLMRFFSQIYKPTKRDLNKYHVQKADLDYLPDDHPLIEYCKDKSQFSFDKKYLTMIESSISYLINTATGEELQTGRFSDSTVKRIYQPFIGKRYYVDYDWRKGDYFGEYELNKNFADKLVNIFYKVFLQSLKLSQTTSTLNYDQILFLGYLMGIKDDGKSLLDDYKKQTAYVIVDEYQDTNYLQDQFINSITNNNLTVVGDIDQAIYEFRGGSTSLIANRAITALNDDPTTVINLTENYRSIQQILDVANTVIKHNQTGRQTRKDLVAVRDKDINNEVFDTDKQKYYGAKLIHTLNAQDEADVVISRIQFLHDEYHVPYNKIAVLIRSRLVLPSLKKEMMSLKLPINDTTHYADIMDSETMTDILDFLKILTNPKDIYAFMAILDKPKKNIGPQKLELIRNLAAKNGMSEVEFVLSDKLIAVKEAGQKVVYQKLLDFSNVYRQTLSSDLNALVYDGDESHLVNKVKEILDETGYLDWMKNQKTTAARRMEDLNIIYGIIHDFEQDYQKENSNYTLIDLTKAFLAQSQDFVKVNDDDGVNIATVHGAKGLEWDHVILAGLDQGIFPMEKDLSNNLESERRLMYVAITRAKDSFMATTARFRLDHQEYKPSMFAEEMKENDNLIENNSYELEQKIEYGMLERDD